MATASELLNYHGDANLALGGTAAPVGVVQTPGLDSASRDLMLLSYQRNKALYDQRIKDRDEVYSMIDDDQLVPNDILDEDRARIDEKKARIQEVFKKYGGDIMSSPDRFREFSKAIQETKQDIKQAQKRYLGVKADMEQRAKAQNPSDMARYDAHIKQQVAGDFYKVYQPYTPLTDFEVDKVAPTPTYHKVSPGPRQVGLWNESDEVIDTDKLFNDTAQNWAKKDYNHYFTNAEGTGYIDMLLSGNGTPQLLERINRGLAKYNQDLGLKPGDKGYVEDAQVQAYQRPDGTMGYRLGEAAHRLAAKIVLSENEAKRTTREWDAQRATYNVQKEKNAIDRDQQKIDWFNAWTERLKAKTAERKSDWEINNGGAGGASEKARQNGAWDFAKNMISDIAGIGTRSRAKDGTYYSTLTAEQIKRMTPDQRKYLGITITKDDKVSIVSAGSKGEGGNNTLKDGFGLIVRDDGKVFTVPDDKVARYGTNINWADRDLIGVADLSQIATTRLKDTAIPLGDGEFGATNNVDTQGENGPTYDRSTSSRGVRGASAANPGGSSTSKSKSGVDYSKVITGSDGKRYYRGANGRIYDEQNNDVTNNFDH